MLPLTFSTNGAGPCSLWGISSPPSTWPAALRGAGRAGLARSARPGTGAARRRARLVLLSAGSSPVLERAAAVAACGFEYCGLNSNPAAHADAMRAAQRATELPICGGWQRRSEPLSSAVRRSKRLTPRQAGGRLALMLVSYSTLAFDNRGRRRASCCNYGRQLTYCCVRRAI